MGQGQLLHPRFQGCLGCHGAGGVLALVSHLRLPMGKGGLVDQQIGSAGQVDRRFTKHGVGAVHNAATGAFWSAEGCAIDHSSVLQGDGATGLEVGVDRPRRDPLGPGLLHVKAAWSGFLVHPVGKGRNPMDEGRAAHGEVGVVQ